MLGLRAAPKDDTGISAALGSKLVLPGPSAKVAANTVESDGPQLPIPSTVKSYDEALVGPPPNLDDAEWVMVAKEKLTGRPLAPAFTGPYLVLERRPKAFKIELGAKADWVSVDRLKKFQPASEDEPADG